jgi:gluconokinase
MMIVLMGPTGAGKTTVGRILAARLGYRFEDADAFHSAVNIDKMSKGIPLDDADRQGWLASIDVALRRWSGEGRGVVFACSLLKRAYRERIYHGPDTRLVYLRAPRAVIEERLRTRSDHFADARLLTSQFAILEEPTNAIAVDATRDPEAIVEEIVARLPCIDSAASRHGDHPSR